MLDNYDSRLCDLAMMREEEIATKAEMARHLASSGPQAPAGRLRSLIDAVAGRVLQKWVRAEHIRLVRGDVAA